MKEYLLVNSSYFAVKFFLSVISLPMKLKIENCQNLLYSLYYLRILENSFFWNLSPASIFRSLSIKMFIYIYF